MQQIFSIAATQNWLFEIRSTQNKIPFKFRSKIVLSWGKNWYWEKCSNILIFFHTFSIFFLDILFKKMSRFLDFQTFPKNVRFFSEICFQKCSRFFRISIFFWDFSHFHIFRKKHLHVLIILYMLYFRIYIYLKTMNMYVLCIFVL